jgi:hypothetical protein
VAAFVAAAPCTALAQQALPAWGRISIFVQSGTVTDNRAGGEADRGDIRFNEVMTSFAWRSREAVDGGAEFAFDGRGAMYPGTERRNRMSVYDGYVGYRAAGGRLGVRGGQMWLNELGGLGAIAGVLVEGRRKPEASDGGTFRVGVFGGLEPSTLELEYAPGIRKAGGYVAYDGARARRHVLGYAQVRNRNLIERSVITTTNYLPVGQRLFVYQAGEYDLTGVGGNGGSRLSYWMTNARVAATSRLEIQGNYHRGRSVDTRSLALDVLNGTPVSVARVQGLLFESMGGRAWVTIVPRVRLTAGYSRDRTNADEAHNDRYQVGGHAWNLAGFDVNVTRSAISGARTYTAWDGSLGRTVGSRLYLTGEYSTNLSSIRLADDGGGFVIEHLPRTKRYGASGLITLSRRYSLLVSGDRTDDGEISEQRLLAGLTVRF